MSRPRVLVTLDTGEELRRGVPLPSLHLKSAYAREVERAGGLPILAAPTEDEDIISELSTLMDALLVTGGAFDIAPTHYGVAATPGVRIDPAKPLRTAFESALLRLAIDRRTPVFGICGGMQLLNVVLGGTLLQDIASQVEDALEHEQPTSPIGPHHKVTFGARTALGALLGVASADVNSTHHQAVSVLGSGLEPMAWSEDGIIEAIGSPDLRLLGVQWHPELLGDPISATLYGALVRRARLFRDRS